MQYDTFQCTHAKMAGTIIKGIFFTFMFDMCHGLTKAPAFNQGANTLKMSWFKPGGLV